LRAGGSQQHTAAAVEKRKRGAFGAADGVVAAPVEAAPDRHVDQTLRKERRFGRCDCERGLLLAQGAQHREGSDDRISGRVLVEAADVAGILASETPTLLLHSLQHVSIPDARAPPRRAADTATPSATTSAPSSLNTCGATSYAAPCAQSTTSFSPLRSSSLGKVLLQNSIYRPPASLTRNALPSSFDDTQAIGPSMLLSIACSTSS